MAGRAGHITPRRTLDLCTLDAHRSGLITAEVGASSPPRPN